MESRSTLTIKRVQNIKIDIAGLVDLYEADMRDTLHEKLRDELGLNEDTAEYICETKGLADTVLNSVKKEMVQRITLQG